MGKTIKILSIDGGGIRGVIPATILDRIEKLTRKPVSKLFDLIAGTSTGGILTLGLTKPDESGEPEYTAGALAGLYREEGSRIFSRSLWRRIVTLDNLTEEKYSVEGIEAVLEKYFGDARLRDATTAVLAPAYEIEKSFPFFFKSSDARTKPGYDFAMRDVARATSAAPTYFEPLKLSAGLGTNEYYALIDGGVFANNPAACALVEAQTTHPDAHDFLVVSLGTGGLPDGIPYAEAKNWGVAQWVRPILGVVFDGVGSTVDYQLRQLLPPTPDGAASYYRFQPTLSSSQSAIDDASPHNIASLESTAQQLIGDNSASLDELCGALVK